MNKQVLLIDDDPIFHMIFTRMIKKVCASLNVISHSNGKIALDYLNKNYCSDTHYIIMLDINMPINNGWQFLDEIKKKSSIQNGNITLFIVTSSTDIEDIKRAKSYDFVEDIFSKPLSINTLEDILRPIIEGKI